MIGKSTKVGIGIIGCSQIARRLVLPAIEETPNAKIVALASQFKGLSHAQEYANQFEGKALASYAELIALPEVEAVYISLPTALQPEWCERALRAGKSVLVEKTMAPSLEQTEKLVELAKRCEGRLLEGYMFKFHPQHHEVRKILSSGQLGEVRSFEAHFGFPGLEPFNIRLNPLLQGGALNDVAGYPVGAARFFFGEPQAVTAVMERNSSGVDTRGSVFLEFSGGISAHCVYGFDHFYQCDYRIWGTKGTIQVNRAFTTPKDQKPEITLETKQGKWSVDLPAHNHFRIMWETFCRAVQGFPSPDFEQDCLLQAATFHAIKQSANEHCRIPLLDSPQLIISKLTGY